ncbi:hypothetical protein, partial [Gottfriedia acidiceleris]|uniref:hypothetical protein n=1 Tax=Gottfriedia acidiceleris TaxID=371036 RepID=UPI002FFF34CF
PLQDARFPLGEILSPPWQACGVFSQKRNFNIINVPLNFVFSRDRFIFHHSKKQGMSIYLVFSITKFNFRNTRKENSLAFVLQFNCST